MIFNIAWFRSSCYQFLAAPTQGYLRISLNKPNSILRLRPQTLPILTSKLISLVARGDGIIPGKIAVVS